MSWNDLIRDELEPMRAYQPGLRGSEVRERSGVDHVLKLSSNEHPDGPFPKALEAIRAVSPYLNRYPDGGCRALRARIASHWGVDERHVCVSSGSNELLRLIGQAVLRVGDEVVFAWPSFVVYPMVAAMFGATAAKVPLDADERHDLAAISGAITDRTRLVYLCNPNNPTGTIYTRREFETFLAGLPAHALLVLDEAYFEFVTDPEYPDGLRYFDGDRPLVVARTFSKMYSLAGLRVGYGIMPEPLVSAVDKIREPFNVNTVAQVAARYSLDDQDEVARRRGENDEQRERLYDAFDRLGIRYARSQANFVYFMTEKPRGVFDALLAQGVIARDFGSAPALRLGVGTPEDTTATIAAFEAVTERLGTL